MKKILSASLLIVLSGGLITLISAQGAQSQPSTKKGSNQIAPALLKDVEGMQKRVNQDKNALIKLQKEKGYDPKIYTQIVNEDNNLDKIQSDLDNLKTKGGNLRDLAKTRATLRQVERRINRIARMKPQVPTTLPEKCVAYRQNPVTGVVDTLNRKWVFLTYQNDQVKYYQFSPDTGWTDSGEQAYPPSRTPRGSTETAYLENGKVICLRPFGK
jgi:hypothetical protein